jgi:hypothetical protein
MLENDDLSWWLKFDSKTLLWRRLFPFLIHFGRGYLQSSPQKSIKGGKKFVLTQSVGVSNNAEFYAEFNPVEKVAQKLLTKRIRKKN